MTMRHRSRAQALALGSLVALAGVGLMPARVSAQQPDFTGVWTTYNEGGGRGGGRGGGGAAPAAGARAGAPAAGAPAAGAQAAGAPAAGRGGGRGGGATLPLTDVARKKVEAYRALVKPTS